MNRILVSFFCFFCLFLSFGFSWEGVSGEELLLQRVQVRGGEVLVKVSGVLQPQDSQFVHDVFCLETGRRVGMVRMMWGFKYGGRYGGVGYVTEGPLKAEWVEGGVQLKFGAPFEGVRDVVLVPRLVPISDR